MNDTGYDHIVVPLDLNFETKQKLELVTKISHYLILKFTNYQRRG